MAADERSVRIDLDPGDDGPQQVAVPDRGPSRRPGLGLLVVLGAVGLIAVLTLGPWRGGGEPTAGVEEAGSNNADQPVTTTSDVPLVSTSEPEVHEVGDARLEMVGSMVRVDLGYLGLLWSTDADGLPRLIRSPDGESWTDVVVTRPDLGPPVDGVDRRYSNLIRTDVGFAMLESVVGPFDASNLGTIPRVRLRRLTSSDGAQWSVDPTFPEIERRTGDQLWILEHTDQMFLAYDEGSVSNAPLAQLLDTEVADGVIAGDPCITQLSADRQTLRVGPCGSSGPQQSVPVDDLRGSVEIGALGDCAQIVGGLFQTHDLVAAWAGDDVPVVYDGLHSRSTWSAAGSGAAVVFDTGHPLPLDMTPCDGVAQLPDRRPPGMVFHGDPGAVPREITLDPGLVDALDEWTLARAAAVVDDEFRVVVDRSMWVLDLATFEWTLSSQPAPSSGESPGGAEGGRFAWETNDDGSLSRVDVLTGRRQTAVLGPATPDSLWSVTDAALLVRINDRVVLVPWTEAGPEAN